MISAYLAGYISGSKLKQCVDWREELKRDFLNIKFIDPMKGEDPKKIVENEFKSNISSKVLFNKDYLATKNTDLFIANLDTFGAKRPLTGTLMELAWAYEFGKTIITYTTGNNYLKHPFLQESCTFMTGDWDKFKETIKFYEGFMKWKE